MHSMLPNDFLAAAFNKSYNKKNMNIQIRSNVEIAVPQTIAEGKLFKKEVKT